MLPVHAACRVWYTHVQGGGELELDPHALMSSISPSFIVAWELIAPCGKGGPTHHAAVQWAASSTLLHVAEWNVHVGVLWAEQMPDGCKHGVYGSLQCM